MKPMPLDDYDRFVELLKHSKKFQNRKIKIIREEDLHNEHLTAVSIYDSDQLIKSFHTSDLVNFKNLFLYMYYYILATEHEKKAIRKQKALKKILEHVYENNIEKFQKFLCTKYFPGYSVGCLIYPGRQFLKFNIDVKRCLQSLSLDYLRKDLWVYDNKPDRVLSDFVYNLAIYIQTGDVAYIDDELAGDCFYFDDYYTYN